MPDVRSDDADITQVPERPLLALCKMVLQRADSLLSSFLDPLDDKIVEEAKDREHAQWIAKRILLHNGLRNMADLEVAWSRRLQEMDWESPGVHASEIPDDLPLFPNIADDSIARLFDDTPVTNPRVSAETEAPSRPLRVPARKAAVPQSAAQSTYKAKKTQAKPKRPTAKSKSGLDKPASSPTARSHGGSAAPVGQSSARRKRERSPYVPSSEDGDTSDEDYVPGNTRGRPKKVRVW